MFRFRLHSLAGAARPLVRPGPAVHRPDRIGLGSRQGPGPLDQRRLLGSGLAGNRPGHRLGPHRRFRRGPPRQVTLLRGRVQRRRVGDPQRGRHLPAHLRRRGQLQHRLHGPGAHQSRHRVGGQRREQQPAQRQLRRRHLPLPGRRSKLAEHGPGAQPAHRAHPGAPRRPQRGVRGGHGPPVGPRRRPRRVQEHRQRRDLAAGSGYRREHRRG